jgi:hypothetical protein
MSLLENVRNIYFTSAKSLRSVVAVKFFEFGKTNPDKLFESLLIDSIS